MYGLFELTYFRNFQLYSVIFSIKKKNVDMNRKVVRETKTDILENFLEH